MFLLSSRRRKCRLKGHFVSGLGIFGMPDGFLQQRGRRFVLQESGRANRKCGRDFILMRLHSGGMETPKTTKTGFRRHFRQSRLKTCRIWVTR
ncbi:MULTISPECIES: hypothetical protein [Neisseria]|nr:MULTISPECIES: hypothetical protein [Neisseria]